MARSPPSRSKASSSSSPTQINSPQHLPHPPEAHSPQVPNNLHLSLQRTPSRQRFPASSAGASNQPHNQNQSNKRASSLPFHLPSRRLRLFIRPIIRNFAPHCRTLPRVRELKPYCLYLDSSFIRRTLPRVRELKLLRASQALRPSQVAPFPGCVN